MMAEPRERLFRDETGAALERVLQLEAENASLREELDRLRSGSRDTVPSRRRARVGPQIVMAGSSMLIALTAVFLMFSDADVRRQDGPRPRTRIPEPTPRVPPVYNGEPRIILGPAAGCEIPYWYDAEGVKHYKPSCLER
jgi:hypothetical protein